MHWPLQPTYDRVRSQLIRGRSAEGASNSPQCEQRNTEFVSNPTYVSSSSKIPSIVATTETGTQTSVPTHTLPTSESGYFESQSQNTEEDSSFQKQVKSNTSPKETVAPTQAESSESGAVSEVDDTNAKAETNKSGTTEADVPVHCDTDNNND